MTFSRVYILGSGAIGMLLAGKLKASGKDVILIRTSVDNFPKKNVAIEIEDNNSLINKYNIPMQSLNEIEEFSGIIVITAKTYANEKIASKLAKSKIDGPIIIMQNGLNVEKSYLKHNLSNIYRVVLFVTSQVIGDFKVRFKPVKASLIGSINGKESLLKDIAEFISTENFEFKDVKNIETLAWEKTILNSIFNSICPLLEIDNGIFQRDKEVLALATELVDEILSVTNQLKLSIDRSSLIEQIIFISKASNGQLISTLQDIHNKRQTEIHSLNLAVSQIASGLNPPIDVHRTEILGKLVKIKSKLTHELNE